MVQKWMNEQSFSKKYVFECVFEFIDLSVKIARNSHDAMEFIAIYLRWGEPICNVMK